MGKFSTSLIFPQIFFLTLALWVGESPTLEGPGYATERKWEKLEENKIDQNLMKKLGKVEILPIPATDEAGYSPEC